MKRILLDESLPRQLSPVLEGLDVVTVVDAGWAGKANGELLALAQREFDVLLTGDRNLGFQQNLTRYDIGVVVAAGRSTKLEDILPLIPRLRKAIDEVRSGEIREVEP